MCNVKINCCLCHIAIMAHKVLIGQQFDSFLAFDSFKERYQNTGYVQFYRKDSPTVEASAARCPKKTLNPAIKFYEANYHCVRRGKKHKPTGTGKKETRYMYIYLFACWFIYSIVHSFSCYFMHSFVQSPVNSFIHSSTFRVGSPFLRIFGRL